ncbi:uncharacterized protein LOC143444267 [Clavelina lepadiformis]|uniref:uncharacterized protein LOC143444267 n=1 Tax=Clavelina lepadiformis TaxID=159417 RepID=UPI0040438B4B
MSEVEEDHPSLTLMSTQWMKTRMLKQTNLTQVTFLLNVKHLNSESASRSASSSSSESVNGPSTVVPTSLPAPPRPNLTIVGYAGEDISLVASDKVGEADATTAASSKCHLSFSRDLRSGGRPSQPNPHVHSMDESSNVKANKLDTSYFLVERETSEL